MMSLPGRSRDRLWGHLKVLSEEIGPRLSGTPGDERTVEYVAAHFERCGAQVMVQDFPCPSWEHEATTLTLLGDGDPEPLEAVAQTFTESADVEAPLVSVGSREDLEYAPDLEHKVLALHGEAVNGLASNRNPTLLTIEERQAAAVIVVSPRETVSTKLFRDPFIRVPAVGVSQSVGQRLLENDGRPVRLRLRARRFDSTGHNVIAHLPGEGPGRIAVAAHYDTAANIPGAADNASGTALVLELCELVARVDRRPVGIDFIAYGAEEYGRHRGNLGAVAYVRRHPREVRETRALVEVDSVGTVAGPPRAQMFGWPDQRKERVRDVLRRFPRCVIGDRTESGRQTAFHLPGVPALLFVDDYAKLPIHTAQDTVELMRPGELVFTTEIVGAVVRHLLAEEGMKTG